MTINLTETKKTPEPATHRRPCAIFRIPQQQGRAKEKPRPRAWLLPRCCSFRGRLEMCLQGQERSRSRNANSAQE